MATLTVTHPMARTEPLSADAMRKLVLWASVAVMVVMPTFLTALVMTRG